jgi:glycerol-3-phosphate O-acyltransferase
MTEEDRKLRIVFMPINKSYMDIIYMHYLNYFIDLEIGFTFGTYEDTPKISFIDRLLRRVGTILIKRDDSDTLE